MLTNTTTIESWEKDKVATLVRRGRLHEVCLSVLLARPSSAELSPIDQVPLRKLHPLLAWRDFLTLLQHLGTRRNIESVLGPRPLFWCLPTVTPGNGLKYPLADGDGKWAEYVMMRRDGGVDEAYSADGNYLPEP